jgi:hypothetical protein
MDPSRFVFLDETGATTNMVRRYGRCAQGERLVDTAPHGHWKTTPSSRACARAALSRPLCSMGR